MTHTVLIALAAVVGVLAVLLIVLRLLLDRYLPNHNR